MPHARALIVLVVVLLAGCGSTTVVREPNVVVSGGQPTPAAPGDMPARSGGVIRIAVVTHGQASSPFWAIVRTGVDAAERQMGVQVDYEAPDVYSLERMISLVDAAVVT